MTHLMAVCNLQNQQWTGNPCMPSTDRPFLHLTVLFAGEDFLPDNVVTTQTAAYLCMRET